MLTIMMHAGVTLLGLVDLLGLVLCHSLEQDMPRLDCLSQEEGDKHVE